MEKQHLIPFSVGAVANIEKSRIREEDEIDLPKM